MIERYKDSIKIFESLMNDLKKIEKSLNRNFDEIVGELLECKGKLVFTGIGKTGIIAKKLAATFSSTGTTAVFLNSAEGLHGDLGVIDTQDIIICISNSGNSMEILSLIPTIKKIGCKIIAITGNIKSKLANSANMTLLTQVTSEICPLNLAPTTSTTASLILGDLLAIALMKEKKIPNEVFALYHPGGELGKRLLSKKVSEIMIKDFATINKSESILKMLKAMTRSNYGICVVRNEGKIEGVIVEGDVRRGLITYDDFLNEKIDLIMNKNFVKIHKDAFVFEALERMENRDNKISVIPVVDDNQTIVGIVRIHDLLE